MAKKTTKCTEYSHKERVGPGKDSLALTKKAET